MTTLLTCYRANKRIGVYEPLIPRSRTGPIYQRKLLKEEQLRPVDINFLLVLVKGAKKIDA